MHGATYFAWHVAQVLPYIAWILLDGDLHPSCIPFLWISIMSEPCWAWCSAKPWYSGHTYSVWQHGCRWANTHSYHTDQSGTSFCLGLWRDLAWKHDAKEGVGFPCQPKSDPTRDVLGIKNFHTETIAVGWSKLDRWAQALEETASIHVCLYLSEMQTSSECYTSWTIVMGCFSVLIRKTHPKW